MADDPISDAIIDGLPVQKALVRGYENLRNIIRMADVSEVRASDLTGIFEISVIGRRYTFDGASVLAHDGDRVMVDLVGNHFIVDDGDSHGRVTISPLNPTGGTHGDIWFKVIP